MEPEQSQLRFAALIMKEDGIFTALCLDVDVASQGATAEEAKRNLGEAVSLYVESAIESNLPIVRPVPREANPLNTCPHDVVETFTMNVDVHIDAYA